MFTLGMVGPNGAQRTLHYDVGQSRITDEHGARLDLSAVRGAYAEKVHQPVAFPVSPANPAGKVAQVTRLKIMLGKACNYSCAYCVQSYTNHRDLEKMGDVDAFLANLGWLDIGDGAHTRIEFWGGEPFVYWKRLRALGDRLHAIYPKANFYLCTNGSLLDDEKIDWVARLPMGISVSHDGPAQALRGPDPFDDPVKAALLRKLYWRLRPQRRCSFNFVAHTQNYDLRAIRAYFREALGDPDPVLGTEEFLSAYDTQALALSVDERNQTAIRHALYDYFKSDDALRLAQLSNKLGAFFASLIYELDANAITQKCGMDLPTSLSVDLKGRVATCQNVTPAGKHNIGTVEAIDSIQLSTAKHWSVREECGKCPVLRLCKGSCMIVNGQMWEKTCDNAFTWNLALLAAALYRATGMDLAWIEGETIRRAGVTRIDF